MTTKPQRWQDLSPTQRRAVGAFAALDLALRALAIVDLVQRPAAEIKGPKVAWGLGLCIVSSGGILPAAYLVLGRRRTD
jgi:hypothetical protein